jgi:purine-binding chemotaxis protein CheW
MDLLLFDLDDRRYALPVAAVRETVRAVAITPLDGAPGVVEGVIDVRGTVTPVFDVRARFGLPAKAVALSDHLVLATAGDRQVALRVDRVRDVATLPDQAMTPARAEDAATRHLAGVARLPDGLVLVHDLDAFLSQGEREALDSALQQGVGRRA